MSNFGFNTFMTDTSMSIPTVTTTANSNTVHFYYLFQYQTDCLTTPVSHFGMAAGPS